ncbi:putative L-aspartate dehydrogenase [Limulus polyphemus]|uniref:Aspartate dehydrogenase domain-containing protein n=1 Tax=Limulus polyphemus TaxID=6850 RepID=A0ABM1TEW7_LIMPO|nr:putative L-aspartate dehydrogenase [Limulus polyphemus]XP_013786112.1 putative L-aspartate dehydrogenase [Limulus polyphemus]XP_022254423.1 putative L-aspartate dehydrogenase [Limulus polyphemus]
MSFSRRRRIGIVGFGHLGQYLVQAILEKQQEFELAFVWNRTKSYLAGKVDPSLQLDDLSNFTDKHPDLVVEVAHPSITAEFGKLFVRHCDYMIGSPTVLADKNTEISLREAATQYGIYIANGALWGGEDIRKMADHGTLKGLKVTMSKHPSCLKLVGELQSKNEQVKDHAVILYQGSVRDLCPKAPNNVNTMAAAAIAGYTLGFDNTQACLISDPSLADYHIVEVEVQGPIQPDGKKFLVQTVRKNPAPMGAVTGTATYVSFLSSMLEARGKGSGFHLC